MIILRRLIRSYCEFIVHSMYVAWSGPFTYAWCFSWFSSFNTVSFAFKMTSSRWGYYFVFIHDIEPTHIDTQILVSFKIMCLCKWRFIWILILVFFLVLFRHILLVIYSNCTNVFQWQWWWHNRLKVPEFLALPSHTCLGLTSPGEYQDKFPYSFVPGSNSSSVVSILAFRKLTFLISQFDFYQS
jgi:hypothetical protein